jgi:hypothetical protein
MQVRVRGPVSSQLPPGYRQGSMQVQLGFALQSSGSGTHRPVVYGSSSGHVPNGFVMKFVISQYSVSASQNSLTQVKRSGGVSHSETGPTHVPASSASHRDA